MFPFLNAGIYIGIAAIVVLVGLAVATVLWLRKIGRLGRAVSQAEAAVDHALTKRFAVLATIDGILITRAHGPAGRFAVAVKWQNGVPAQAHVADKAAFSTEIDAYANELEQAAKQDPSRFSDAAFGDLLRAFELTGEQLDTARRLYNATVAAANQTISAFPGILFANALRLEKRDFFEIGSIGNDSEGNG